KHLSLKEISLSDFLACSEVVQERKNKDMFLSFGRRPRPPWRDSSIRSLSKERTVVKPEMQSTNLSFVRVNVFSHCSA
ncbi:MAG: hypothetical protein ACE5GV_04365, partial [Candidatus Scalindua sp.]